MTYKGYDIMIAHPTEAKAGRDQNCMSTVQVRDRQQTQDGHLLRAQFSFVRGEMASLNAAIQAATNWVDRQ